MAAFLQVVQKLQHKNVDSPPPLVKLFSLTWQVKRGTIQVRRDPSDTAEWQFALKKAVTWTEEEMKHGFKGGSSAKAEVAQWMELKAQGLFKDDSEVTAGNQALDAVLGGKNKDKLPLEDKDQQSPGRKSASSKAKGGQVVEADLLSEMGGKLKTEEAHVRISRMVKLLKEVKNEVDEENSTPLDQCLTDLQKLGKMGKKLKMDHAKGKLFDAALQIKKAKAQ